MFLSSDEASPLSEDGESVVASVEQSGLDLPAWCQGNTKHRSAARATDTTYEHRDILLLRAQQESSSNICVLLLVQENDSTWLDILVEPDPPRNVPHMTGLAPKLHFRLAYRICTAMDRQLRLVSLDQVICKEWYLNGFGSYENVILLERHPHAPSGSVFAE